MNVQSPAWCGRDAMAYISEYYQAFEDAVYAQDAAGNCTGYNAETGKYYYEYCDLTSLVQVYLLQRLAADACAVGVSLSFYKDAGGLLYAALFRIWSWPAAYRRGPMTLTAGATSCPRSCRSPASARPSAITVTIRSSRRRSGLWGTAAGS